MNWWVAVRVRADSEPSKTAGGDGVCLPSP